MQKEKLPSFFKAILWSYKLSEIDPKKHKRTIIVQTINYGQWPHWKWIAQNYGKGRVRRVIENTATSEFRPPALKLASLIFNIKKMKYASRSAYVRNQKTLARA